MDSSHTDQAGTDSFSPWQIGRLTDRLMNYKAAKRHGWERIATDILFVEELPEDYVDSEEVRPLSESLRRLANGTQIPSEQRLNAVKLFLIDQGYLASDALDQGGSTLQAPLAFVDFITAASGDSRQRLARFAAFEGTYSVVHDMVRVVRHERLSLAFQNGFFNVAYEETFLKNIDSIDRLVEMPNVRKRAISREDKYEGWAACGPFGQIMIFATDVAYEKRPKFFIIWADQKRAESNGPVTAFLSVPYDGVRGVDDLEEIHKALEGGCDPTAEPAELTNVRPRFQKFTRSEGRGV